MMHWVQQAARRFGIDVSPATVICPEHVKTVGIDADGRARIDVRETLVFLKPPKSGDLWDVCSMHPEAALDTFVRHSPDAIEGRRRRRSRDTVVINWKPKDPVVPYALYDHQYSWFPPGSHAQPALCAEFHCEKRTGTFVLEMITRQGFEAAVAFPRPGWIHTRSERTLVKYALKQLERGGERPAIDDSGQRVEWRIAGPRLGRRYVCVVFQRYGVALWQDALKKGVLRNKIEQLMGRLSPDATPLP